MTNDPGKPLAPQVASADEPEIYGIKQGANGLVLNRRSFLGATAASGVLAACGSAAAAQGAPAEIPKAHKGKIDGVFMLGQTLFSWDTNTLKAWDFTKGTLKKAVPKGFEEDTDIPNLLSHLWEAPQVAIGPGALTLALSSPDGIKLYKSAKSGADTIFTLKEAAQPVHSLAFAPDGTRFAAGSADGSVTLWSLQDGKVQQRFEIDDYTPSLALHPDGAILLSGHTDGTVRSWQLPEGKAGQRLANQLNGHRSIRILKITPDGSLAATTSTDAAIKLWELPEGKQKGRGLPLESEIVSAMDISEDSHILAAATTRGHIYLWRLPEGTMQGCLFDPALTPGNTQIAQYQQMGGTVCTCDTIAVPAGLNIGGVCTCNTVAVCSCVGHVSSPGGGGGGSHYWRPN
jgi:hypothetical protein